MKKIVFVVFCLFFARSIIAEPIYFRGKGYFSTSDGGILVKPRKHSGDFELERRGESIVRMVGPIFNPGYRISRTHDIKIDLKDLAIQDIQKVKGSDLAYTQKLTSKNGGVLVDVKLAPIDKSVNRVSYRILLPVKYYKGKNVSWNGGKSFFPVDAVAGKKIIVNDNKDQIRSFRFAMSPEMDLGVRVLSPVKSTLLRDCRHHSNNEQNFDLTFNLDGDSFQYFLCLLNPSEEFPSLEKNKTKSKSVAKKKENLLLEGSSFEAGQDGVNFVNHYSWCEEFTDPAIPIVLDNSTAVHGKYSAKMTAEDIKPKRGRFRIVCCEFNRVPLKPDQKYTLSAWMKASAPGLGASLKCSEVKKARRSFKLSQEWKRYHITFTTPKVFSKLGYCNVSIGLVGKKSKGNVWVDGIQLEEGDLSDYIPSAELEMGISVPVKHKLFPLGEDVSCDLLLRNNGAEKISFNIDYVLKDYWENIVKKGSIPISMKGNSNLKHELNFGELPGGYYRFYCSIPNRGTEETIFGVYDPQGNEILPPDWPVGGDTMDDPIVRQLGFGSVRPWNFEFWRVCPEKGKFNFKETDILVDRAERFGLLIMPIFGSGFTVSRHKGRSIPEWARKNKEPIALAHGRKVYLPTIEAWKTYVSALVERYRGRVKYWEVMNEPNTHLTPDAYFPYLKAAYEAAKEADPDCKIVGVCSTSDLGGQPAPWTCRVLELGGCKYFDILSIHMYGGASPEKSFGKGSDKMMEFLKDEMKKYGKEAPIWHTEKTYCTRTSGYSTRKLNRPYVYEHSPVRATPDFKTKAEYLIRESILCASAGKGPFMWHAHLPNNTKIASHRYPNYISMHHIEYDGAPTPQLLGVNGLARALKGRSHPHGQLNWGDLNRCALFSSETDPSESESGWLARNTTGLFSGSESAVAAVWNTQGKCEISIPVDSLDIEVYDFFGEKIESPVLANGRMKIELDTAPKYIVFPNSSLKGAKDVLKEAALSGGKGANVYGALEIENAAPVLNVYVKNDGLQDINGDVRIVSLPKNWTSRTGGKAEFSDLKIGAVKKLTIPLAKINPSNDIQKINVEISAGEGKYPLEIQVLPFSSEAELKRNISPSTMAVAQEVKANQIKIDGDLSEWNKEKMIGMGESKNVVGGFGKWNGSVDHSASVGFAWDSKFLYVAVKVYDDKIIRNFVASRVWASDSFELFLDFDDSDKNYDKTTKDDYSHNKDDFQGLFAPPSGGATHNEASAWWTCLKSGAGTKIESQRFPGGYTLEMAIPWKGFPFGFAPSKGKEIGCSFIINDSDDQGAPESRMIWQGTPYNYKTPKDWGRLKFE